MGGIFGVAAKRSCTMELFYGVDYHSHLGTRRGGMTVYGEQGFMRAIHNIENSPFRVVRRIIRSRFQQIIFGRLYIQKA